MPLKTLVMSTNQQTFFKHHLYGHLQQFILRLLGLARVNNCIYKMFIDVFKLALSCLTQNPVVECSFGFIFMLFHSPKFKSSCVKVTYRLTISFKGFKNCIQIVLLRWRQLKIFVDILTFPLVI